MNPDSYLSGVQGLMWYLSTGEEVSLRGNPDIYHPDGQFKRQARFSAGRDNQLLTMSWPKLATRCVSALSRWRLVITQATDDRIASFSASTAEKLSTDQWEVVKKVVEDCRGKFHARLLSLACWEIVFAHEDKQSAEKMKDSNEMVDVMNSLLADLEYMFHDIAVDWEVEITSYHPAEGGEEQSGLFGSLIFTDADSPPLMQSSMSRASSANEDLPPHFQRLVDIIASESRKTHDALEKLAAEGTNRHRIICQKIEELKNSIRHLDPSRAVENQDGVESDVTYFSDSAQLYNTEKGNSIPSAELFEEPASGSERSVTPHSTVGNKLSLSQSPAQREDHHPPHHDGSKQKKQQDQTPQRGPSTTEVLHKDPAKPYETFQDSLCGSHLENRNLDDALERAYKDDDVPPPRAKSFYTLLCLDISESMKEHGSFDEMKKVVEQFIDGVEDTVSLTGVEENIGVVTFGGTSNVVQNLTNDFSLVRDAVDRIQLGGRSPFVQALMVSMAAFVHKASIVSVSGVYHVRPRIIFISDGYPTENVDGPVDYACNKMQVRSALTCLMMDFAKKEKYSKVKPVIYIPVGRNPDKDLLKSMAMLSMGQYMEPKDVGKLCSYFLVQETVGKTLACVRNSGEKHTEEQIKALATGLMPELDAEQKDEVVRRVLEEQALPTTHKTSSHGPNNMEDMYENTDKVNAGDMLPLGTRVLRGPDWHWGDQDGGGPGTIIFHDTRDNMTYVYWDTNNTHNRYAYGPNIGYQIWKTDAHPRLMGDGDVDLQIGMTVQRGPDWCYHDMESLRQVCYGVVIRKSRSKRKVMVRWDNAEIQVLRWGAEDKYDVMYCPPEDIPKLTPLEFRSFSSTPLLPNQDNSAGVPANLSNKEPTPSKSATDFDEGKWQWRDEYMDWNDYPPQDNARIEKSFKKKSDGSCIVSRDGRNRRIMFRRMTEKVVDGGMECPVRRVPV